jgi:phosphoglycerate kinase
MRSLAELPVEGAVVLVRTDFNVPLGDAADGSRVITDDGRIRGALPTLKALVDRGARVVVATHLGRPGGTVDPSLSLAPVAQRLGVLLEAPTRFVADTVGADSRAAIAGLRPGEVLVLENLRFHAAETSKSAEERSAFAEALMSGIDYYVGEGFGTIHRAHASVLEAAALRPNAPGLLVQAEVDVLQRLTVEPARPYTVILGGSKVSDKLAVIDSLLTRCDRLLIGGGMAFTFLAATGRSVGSSLLEAERIDTCHEYLARAESLGVELVLPVDVVVADRFAADADHRIVALDDIPEGWMGLDIGPSTAALYTRLIEESATVFWNGPMGVFEMPAFAEGTRGVADALARCEGLTVVGGGDSAAAVRLLGFGDDAYSHISTGGGASLEYLEGRALPGLVALEA